MSALENTGPYTGPNSAGLGALAVWARGRLALDIATAGYCRAATIAGCELLWRFSCSHCLLLTGALKERTLPGEHVLPSPAAKDRERETAGKTPSLAHRDFTCSWEFKPLAFVYLGAWFCPQVTYRDCYHRAACVQALKRRENA